jgi:hypothetical protein
VWDERSSKRHLGGRVEPGARGADKNTGPAARVCVRARTRGGAEKTKGDAHT